MHPRIEGVLMQLVLQPLLEWSRFLFSLLCALILFGDHSPAHNPMQLDWSRSIVGAARTRGYNRMTFHGRVCPERLKLVKISGAETVCVESCSLHLSFLIFRMEKNWSLNAFLRTSFCFQLRWCIYFMLGILEYTITSFISPSSLMPFTHSKIIRVIYEVNKMHNRLNFLVFFPLSYVIYPPMYVVFREGEGWEMHLLVMAQGTI